MLRLPSRCTSHRQVANKHFIEIMAPQSSVSMKKVELLVCITRWGHLWLPPNEKLKQAILYFLKQIHNQLKLFVHVLKILRCFFINFSNCSGLPVFPNIRFWGQNGHFMPYFVNLFASSLPQHHQQMFFSAPCLPIEN